MRPHVCPWWGGYFIDNRLRHLLHRPERILAPYVKAGMTVMDVGCGMGFFAIPAARLVGAEGRVIAVDLQQQMLDVLMRRAAKAGADPVIVGDTVYAGSSAGRLVAEAEDYAKVYELVSDIYRASASGASQGVREAVRAVAELLTDASGPVTVTQVAAFLGWSKMAASRRVSAALKGGWLTNSESRKGYPYHLGIGEPLPAESGLLPPESLRCNAVTPLTGTEGEPRRSSDPAENLFSLSEKVLV